MAKLPGFKRLMEDDYSTDFKGLVKTLGLTINGAFDSLFQVLNGKLTLADNLDSTVKSLDIEVDANGKPKTRTSFKLNGIGKIEGVLILRVDNLDNATTYPSGGVTVSFTETATEIIINNVTGLVPNNLYRIRFVALR